MAPDTPRQLDVRKDRGLTIEWADGTTAFYSVAYLRRMSPSADMKTLREAMDRNPLTVLPSAGASGPLTILDAELRGNYALWLRFSDGHATGIYSWAYLKEIQPHAGGEADGTARPGPDGDPAPEPARG